jgi:hypothetical protein
MANNNMFSNLKLKEKATTVIAPAAGRPRGAGKSSDPNYRSTTVYLKRETIKKAQVKLIEKELDFSSLVESLVQDWINNN